MCPAGLRERPVLTGASWPLGAILRTADSRIFVLILRQKRAIARSEARCSARNLRRTPASSIASVVRARASRRRRNAAAASSLQRATNSPARSMLSQTSPRRLSTMVN